MYAADRDALICDMAETYHIFDVWSVPVPMFATLACGLRSNSRIKMKLAGYKYIPPELGIFMIHDIMAKVFSEKDSKPYMMVEAALGEGIGKPKGVGFNSSAEFDAWREKMLRGSNNG